MPDFLGLILLAGILVAGILSYIYLHKVKNLIGYHLGMNIAMTSSGISGLAIGAILSTWFHHHLSFVIIITTLLAIAIGILFGSLVDYQTVISGATSGMMSGLMGPMLGGSHLNEPVTISVFCTLLACISFFMLCFSVRE